MTHTDADIQELYQIGDLVRKVGVSLRTIRYYEEEGLLKPTAKTQGGLRLYSERDIFRLKYITTLRHLNMSIEEIKTVLSQNAVSSDSRSDLIKRSYYAMILTKQKIDEEQNILNRLKENMAEALESIQSCLECQKPSCTGCPQKKFILA